MKLPRLGVAAAVLSYALLGAGAASADPKGIWQAQAGAHVKVGPCGAALCATIATPKSAYDPETGRPWTDKHNPDSAQRSSFAGPVFSPNALNEGRNGPMVLNRMFPRIAGGYMKDIVVIGAGKIGAFVAGLLASTGHYQVTLADRSAEVLGNLDRDERIRLVAADVEDSLKLVDLLNGRFAVLNAAPFRLTKHIAEAARAAGTHYLDLTEDVVSTRRVKELAANADTAFIPQCGLAPGFVSIVASDVAKGFHVLDSVRLRVGALPQYPSNALNYNLTWSTDGVINEYCEACEAIVNGVRREAPPLEEREEFSLDGVTYEAFNTSGGVGTLCDTLEGKVRTLNYRTIRYPGHATIMRALLNDLRLRDRRDVLKDILEHAVPTTLQDVVIIFVTVSGHKKGHLVQETYANKIYSREVDGRTSSAIQITTAAAICTVLDLLATGQLPQSGFIRQEDIPLKVFLQNRFGEVYAKPEKTVPHQRIGG
jgi:saccharopine dehydrogenase-like NADP-dependent oxidoreductase